MLDQAAKLRQMAEQYVIKEKKIDIETKVLTITSGKGGVGKSNIVVNLGIALQKLGKKVMIFDADLGMGNDDVLIGCIPKYSVFDIIFNEKEINEVLVEGPHGIKLLPGGSGISKVDDLTEVQRMNFLKKLENIEGYDYILIDTGAGINRSVLGFIACSDEFLVISTPEPTSLTDAYSLLKAVNHFKIKTSAKIIVNRVIDEKEGNCTFNKLNNAAERFLNIKLYHLGNVSDDSKVTQAVRKQTPLVLSYPSTDFTKDINKIANDLQGINCRMTTSGVQELFKRIFKVFS
ncbi:MinD/ParA family protein [Clostridium sp. UBA4548]|uniref:MinD/ParA family protein n=1 Tax=Clostridium sp. UBA4548 TaxID=1946361 RepID=UPI0025BCE18B|nr:MinD/ParA family protein [Clostridium sp. UBA4548]